MRKMITTMLSGTSCKSVGAFLMDYIEGRLEPKTVDRFEAHISSCPNCRRYLDQYRETVSLLKEIPIPPIPAELEERVCQFINDALGIDPDRKF